ncbi:hypothetical protein HU200_023747 [Digitaria exilis]|uniref:Trichome birefringence-like N-terminal domain-containing protein n=1 Tax=Digitaria exilis TaxID=1010633 RepID=A0A835EU48_9POAL|nr:hypothetical protein HU200_023747 [Digitaria exilis]CAB3499682.1 unnamed protein product [Digitaria exilis]
MLTYFLKTQQLQNDKQLFLLPKRQLVTYAIYALIAVALLYLFVDPAAPASSTAKPSVAAPWMQEELTPPSSSPPPHYHERSRSAATTQVVAVSSSSAWCDYTDGEWVPDPRPPPYNGTACEAIKDGRSCMANGRTDTGYLHWRWQPRQCDLPDFSPEAFLTWLRNKHMAFVGDSLARNQAESLMCLLTSRSPAELVRREEDGRFRRWVFRQHNATVSIFWSPFLVRGVEKSEHDGVRYNELFLDAFDERWMSRWLAGGGDGVTIDAAVVSVGQWFRIPSVYHEGGKVVGCYGCAAELNHTETSFFAVFRDVLRRTLAEITRRNRHEHGHGEKLVALTTFSPSHFDGEWNKGAPCTKTTGPYRKGEKEMGYTETEMRKIVVEEAAAAAAAAAAPAVRFAAVDVTAMANLRPDGHPGPYMRKNPFAAVEEGRPVQHDCLHWCMPGPVDTFNQILLQTMLR